MILNCSEINDVIYNLIHGQSYWIGLEMGTRGEENSESQQKTLVST